MTYGMSLKPVVWGGWAVSVSVSEWDSCTPHPSLYCEGWSPGALIVAARGPEGTLG